MSSQAKGIGRAMMATEKRNSFGGLSIRLA
jgi:hypothetical protein